MSFLDRSRFRREDSGYGLRLPDGERQLLSHLLGQLTSVLDGVERDDSPPEGLERLFPRAHSIDEAAEERFAESHRHELLEFRSEALATMAQTIGARRLSDDEADAWLTGLNSLRLVIGTRLDVQEELVEVLESDPAYADWICYQYLSFLESELVDAMTGALPPPTPGAGDDLPEDPWGEPLGGLRWDGTPLPDPPTV